MKTAYCAPARGVVATHPPDVAVIAFGANDEDSLDSNWWRAGLTDFELHHFDGQSAGEVDAKIFFRMFIAGLNLTQLAAETSQLIFGGRHAVKQGQSAVKLAQHPVNQLPIFGGELGI